MHDLVIVGAGPVGATLALTLASGAPSRGAASPRLDVVALDARAPGASARGERTLALSHGSRLIFERLGIWTSLAARAGAVTAITQIDISQRGDFGAARLDADQQGVPALGYVVSYHALQAALDEGLSRTGVRIEYETRAEAVVASPDACEVRTACRGERATFRARLAAIADGGGAVLANATRHRHDYRQVALTAKIGMRHSHGGVAYERFTSEGPMALLPEPGRYGLVWTATAARAAELLSLSDRDFLSALQRQFGPRVQGFERVSDRRSFPLTLEFVHRVAQRRCVMLGNAAQALHPVAGQGFNLGVRDAYELAQELLCAPREKIGSPQQIARYSSRRRSDRMSGIGFTHALLKVFANDTALVRWPRGIALALLDATPPLRRSFTRAMLFGMR